ncbi:hypothetical protein [Amycolatopsis pithecellobii]|uniref:Uncharacterized protein n=1 Tax=Amycolatopsis pithecellobii TaxID=664692 RepID=A0A6N7YV13_9PSEU|nr:hypothetical protein [Amycolatopsis pithecellobii]MTD56917.1 hypothetical protein [Amycolatopsis pithecellobii]
MDEHGIENHPGLMDPDWQRHAEKEAWVDQRRTRRRRRRGRRLVIFAVVLVVVAGAGIAVYRWGKASSEHYSGGGAVSTTTAPAPTDLPDFARVDLSRPFENTPAQNWAEGIAGLTVPPATKVGAFSKEQVASALDQVKQAIVVASLDPEVLQRHNVEKYTALLAPDARGDVRAHPESYLVLLADGYPLLPVAPRMTGGLTVQAGKPGELTVHADYVVTYAFDPGSRQVYGPGDLEPFLRIQADYVVTSGSNYQKSSWGLWLDQLNRYYTEAACGALKQDRVAPAFSENFDGPSVTPEPGEFDPSKPMPTGENCPG